MLGRCVPHRFHLVLAALLGLAAAIGPDASQADTASQSTARDPEALVTQGIEDLTELVEQAAGLPNAQAEALLKAEIGPYFDFRHMARAASGPIFRQLSEAQKVNLVSQVQNRFFATMLNNLQRIRGELPKVTILPTRASGPYRSVTARVVRESGPTRSQDLEFRFYRADDGWKVFDVATEGASLILHLRRDIQQEIRMRGVQAAFTGY